MTTDAGAKRGFRPAWTIVLGSAVVVAILVVSSGATVGTSLSHSATQGIDVFASLGTSEPPHPVARSESPGPAASPATRAIPSTSTPYVSQTLDLANDSVVPGNYEPTVAVDPVGVVVDSGRGEIFVADYSSGTVSVLNASSGRVVAQVPVAADPVQLAYDPAQNEVFVSCQGPSVVDVIADGNNTVIASIPVADQPQALAFDNASGQIFVASWDPTSYTGLLTIINGSSNHVAGTVRVGSYATGVAYDSATNEVFVANSNPGYDEGTVTVVSGATDLVVTTIPVGEDPYDIAYDAALGELFVADEGSCSSILGIPLGCSGGGVSVVSDATDAVVANVSAVSGPAGITVDNSTGGVLVSVPGTCFLTCSQGEVAVVDTANDSVVERIAVLAGSFGIAYDAEVGRVFVPNQGGGCSSILGISFGCVGSSLSVLSGLSYALQATIPLSTNPISLALDSGTGQLFVGDAAFDTVRVVWPTNGTPAANLSLPMSPAGLVYDSGKGEVFVTESTEFAGRNVSVISDVTDSIVATVQLPAGSIPTDLAYDPSEGTVYVVDSGTNSVSVISDATNSVLTTVRVGEDPAAVVANPAAGQIYVGVNGLCGYSFCSEIAVLNTTNNSVVADVPIGPELSSLAYDPATDELYVATSYSGVDVVSTSTDTIIANVSGALAFGYSAVYDATNHLVYVSGGANEDSISAIVAGENTVEATINVGSAPVDLAVDPTSGLVYSANMGQGTISYLAPGNDSPASFYPLIFEESGLKAGLRWALGFAGGDYEGNASTISFAETNGSWPYAVVGPSGWRVEGIAASGDVGVAGAPVVVQFHFVHGRTFTAKFDESGLGQYQWWCVRLVVLACSDDRTISVPGLSTGTYPYSLVSPTVNQTISARQDGRSVPVGGSLAILGSASVTLTFRYYYTVSFTQSGLVSGTWSITYKGFTRVGEWNQAIEFNATNGTSGYHIGRVPGFVTSGSPKRVVVDGGPVAVRITYR